MNNKLVLKSFSILIRGVGSGLKRGHSLQGF